MYLLWNLPFFKMVLLKTNFFSFLKPRADNGSTNQCIVLGLRADTSCVILSQKCMFWVPGLGKLPQPRGVSFI